MLAVVTHPAMQHFWPTTFGSWAAGIAACGGLFAAVMSVRNRAKIQIVHDLVDGQRTVLENNLAAMTGKRDELVDEREAKHTDG